MSEEFGLRDYLGARFDSQDEKLDGILSRLTAVEGRVAETNGQVRSHRMRLESLETAATDPLKAPAMTIAERRMIARAGGAAAAILGALWAIAEGAIRVWPHVVPAVLALVR